MPAMRSRVLGKLVMAGLDPAIHLKKVALYRSVMDARVKPGHDGERGKEKGPHS
jgi:hypothetical protein